MKFTQNSTLYIHNSNIKRIHLTTLPHRLSSFGEGCVQNTEEEGAKHVSCKTSLQWKSHSRWDWGDKLDGVSCVGP